MEVISVTADAEAFTCNAYLSLGERTVFANTGTVSGIEDVVAGHTDDLNAMVVIRQHSGHVGELGAAVEWFDPDVYVYTGHPLRTHELGDGDHAEMGSESFEVVYAPSHADDHVSLVSGRSLFSGGMFVYNGGALDDSSFGRTDMPEQSRERLISSLHTLLGRLPSIVEALHAGHGSPFENEAGGDTIHNALGRVVERAEWCEPEYPEA